MDLLRPGQDPSRIADYQLLGRLGAGGMGQVYLARSTRSELVAIKVIRDEIASHPQALSRFRREVATVARVRYDRTARLIEASLDAPPYWLATEYIPGPTLRQEIVAGGPFPAAQVRALGAELAHALAGVHAQGITHRDVKPQNVVLGQEGPRLIDFGIARSADDIRLTATGAAHGTPGFTAPEVLLRDETSPAADVFGLGATMAYALTGRPPFGGGAPEAVSYRAVYEDVDLEGTDADPALIALVQACVTKDPAGRPTAADLAMRCEGAHATVAQTLVAGARRRRSPRTRTAVAALLSVVLVAVSAIAARGWGQSGDETDARSPVPVEASSTGESSWSREENGSLDGDPGERRAYAPEDVRWKSAADAQEARLGVGACDRPSQGLSQGSISTSVVYRSGSRKADVRLSVDGAGPQRLVVGVKPPEARGFGYTTAPARVTSQTTALVYPSDFTGGPAVTLAGDWTVVVYSATSDDRSTWSRLSCTGFRAR
ncbi:serine/threonine-protein kinase [Streptomyces parvus]|uniref:Serine/threonine protein kinase n=1 Tax=Streptomyces parvus TaxID=66428 RepID=A0A5D4IHW8_9ACTN|nr:serine/threonine-protein kinase [Streptomyces parvus]TYR51649.1 serine/threonine protein kinase [Streptomyces parvus]